MGKGRSTWGSIRKRGKESWEIRYPVGPKSRSETIRGSRSDAERRLAELRIEYEGATPDMTISEFWDGVYYPDIQKHLAPSTVVGYRRKYQRHILPKFGGMRLDELRPKDVQAWLLEMTKENARHCKVVLSAMYRCAMANDLADDNVADRNFRIPKSEERPRTKEVYTLEQLDAIFEACRGELWEAIFILSAYGGALRSEAMGVRVGEVENRDGFAVVPIVRNVQRLDGEVRVIENTKTEARGTDLVIPPPYSSRLFEIQAEALENGDTWLTDNGFGAPNCPERMAKAYERWFQHQSLRYIPFGNLRNAYSTALHNLEIEDSTVAKLMRHSNLSTDFRHYNRLSTDDKIEALSKVMGNIAHNCP